MRMLQSVRGAHRQHFPLPATASPPFRHSFTLGFSQTETWFVMSCLAEGISRHSLPPAPTQLSLPLHRKEQGSVRPSLWGAGMDPGLWDGGRKRPSR